MRECLSLIATVVLPRLSDCWHVHVWCVQLNFDILVYLVNDVVRRRYGVDCCLAIRLPAAPRGVCSRQLRAAAVSFSVNAVNCLPISGLIRRALAKLDYRSVRAHRPFGNVIILYSRSKH